jgi:hypothetical protein
VRTLLVLAIVLFALSACKTAWQPPPGTGYYDRQGSGYDDGFVHRREDKR